MWSTYTLTLNIIFFCPRNTKDYKKISVYLLVYVLTGLSSALIPTLDNSFKKEKSERARVTKRARTSEKRESYRARSAKATVRLSRQVQSPAVLFCSHPERCYTKQQISEDYRKTLIYLFTEKTLIYSSLLKWSSCEPYKVRLWLCIGNKTKQTKMQFDDLYDISRRYVCKISYLLSWGFTLLSNIRERIVHRIMFCFVAFI